MDKIMLSLKHSGFIKGKDKRKFGFFDYKLSDE